MELDDLDDLDEIFETYDLCTEEGAVVVALEGETALVADPEAGAKPIRIPASSLMIHEVYSEESIEPLELPLPAPLPEVLEALEKIEKNEKEESEDEN